MWKKKQGTILIRQFFSNSPWGYTYNQYLINNNTMRHPIEECNQNQTAILATLPEDNREWMARMFRIGNATYHYYNRAKELAVFDTGDQPAQSRGDLLEWLEQQLDAKMESQSARELLTIYWGEYLEGLPHEGLRRAEEEMGLEKAKSSLPFQRYVLERHDIGMDEFLRLNLSAEDYSFHQECGKPLTG